LPQPAADVEEKSFPLRACRFFIVRVVWSCRCGFCLKSRVLGDLMGGGEGLGHAVPGSVSEDVLRDLALSPLVRDWLIGVTELEETRMTYLGWLGRFLVWSGLTPERIFALKAEAESTYRAPPKFLNSAPLRTRRRNLRLWEGWLRKLYRTCFLRPRALAWERVCSLFPVLRIPLCSRVFFVERQRRSVR